MIFGSSNTECIDNSIPSDNIPYEQPGEYVQDGNSRIHIIAQSIHDSFVNHATLDAEQIQFAIHYNLVMYKLWLGQELSHDEGILLEVTNYLYKNIRYRYHKGKFESIDERQIQFMAMIDGITNSYYGYERVNWLRP